MQEEGNGEERAFFLQYLNRYAVMRGAHPLLSHIIATTPYAVGVAFLIGTQDGLFKKLKQKTLIEFDLEFLQEVKIFFPERVSLVMLLLTFDIPIDIMKL